MDRVLGCWVKEAEEERRSDKNVNLSLRGGLVVDLFTTKYMYLYGLGLGLGLTSDTRLSLYTKKRNLIEFGRAYTNITYSDENIPPKSSNIYSNSV